MKRAFKITLTIIILFSLTACSNSYDQNAKDIDFTYVLTASGTNQTEYINELQQQPDTADKYIILARLTKNETYYKEAIKLLKQPKTDEQKILNYQTIYSLTGNKIYLIKSYFLNKRINPQNSEITLQLILNKLNLNVQPKEIEFTYLAPKKNTTKITIGESYFFITPKDKIISQTDRVTRDWLTQQLTGEEILTVFSEAYDVDDIGWHEGARIKELTQLNLSHTAVQGTLVAKYNDNWYAPNENNTFMFEVPFDKISYPTTRFLTPNLALIIDTHGINMLVEQAINQNATVVIGCCDHPGKIVAAEYLAERNIKVICNTDKYLPLILGKDLPILGSAPFEMQGDQALVGFKPLTINITEPVIILNSTEYYGLSYYSTPSIYFTILQKKTLLDFNITIITVDDYNQLNKLIQEAEKQNARIIAARVYNENDYSNLKQWLEKDKNNKLIIFHSEAYPYGYKLAREFPQQTTFDDINIHFS